MNRHLRPFAGLCLCAGLLFSGYMLVPAPDVMARPTAKPGIGRDQPSSPVTRPETTITSLRPPVPLLVSGHTTYFVEDPQLAATTAQSGAMETQEALEKSATSATAAKAMIEADGYKIVSALKKISDSTWAGGAMRGSTQVAVTVDASGSVSAQ